MHPRVAVLAGAGLSTASGIPDYRSADGMWARFEPDEFHITRFHADPDRFWARRMELMQGMRLLDAAPNEGHRILARAAHAGAVAHIVTQNIDGLHHKAGTPQEKVLEVHGNAALCRCMTCGGKTPTLEVVKQYEGKAPRCACGGVLKPDVVLFGEPVTELERAQRAILAADRLVTVGTSLQVWPVAGLVEAMLAAGREVTIINRGTTPFDHAASQVIDGDVIDGLRMLFPDHVDDA